jgi:DUF4097 and DUF4098 domain-containing protein YvlB
MIVSTAASTAYAQERVSAKFNDPSRPGLLKVNWHNGSIIIKTHSTNDVTIDTKSRPASRREPAETAGLRRIDGGGRGVSIDSDANNVMTINGPNSSFGGELEIEVPAKTNLNLQSYNGRTISVDGVEGDIEATNHNGSVELTNVGGSVVAHSMNGRVVVSFRDIAAGKPMSFSSMNGSVDVTLPATAKADLKMRTDNGGVWTDFDIQTKAASTTTNSDQGRYRIEIDKTINGSINGGGSEIELRTRNGNIYLRKAK